MTSSQVFTQSATLSELDHRSSQELRTSLGGTSADDTPLRDAVDAAMRRYFAHLDGCTTVTDLHAMVMAEVEAPLLASVLDHTQGNQTQAAAMLGLNRGTLRKKLKQYGLI